MSSGKRILLVTPGFPADESDTTCIPALWTWVKAYAEKYQDHELHVVALHYPFTTEEYRFHGVRVTPLCGANPSGVSKAWFILDSIHRIRKIIQEERPHVVHAFWMNATAFIAWHASRGLVPVAVNLMGQDIQPSLWYTLLRRKLITYIAPSARSLSALKKVHPAAHANIAHFGVHCQAVPAVKRDIDLLGVGSLVPVKRFRDFIRTVELLATERPTLRCVIAGEGPERAILEKLISESGLGEQIQLIGKCSLTDVHHWMSRSRILLHPSENEGFGMVFAEALCNGMMIVSRAVGTAEPAPWWAIANRPEEMADAVQGFLDNPVEIPGSALFSMERACISYRQIYDDICRDA